MANLFKAVWRGLGWDTPRGEDATVVQELAKPLLEEYQSTPLSDYFTVGVISRAEGGYSREFRPTPRGEDLLRLYWRQRHTQNPEAPLLSLLPHLGGWERAPLVCVLPLRSPRALC
jgi:hypothetical protein